MSADVQSTTYLGAAPASRSLHWISGIPLVGTVFDRIGETEFRRRLLHMTPGIIPLGLPLTPHGDVWEPWLWTMAVVFMSTGLLASILAAPVVKRHGDENFVPSIWGYIVPPFAAFLLFPGRSELALMTLQIIAFGDGSATLGGKFFGGRKLPWNRQKSWSGLACFIVMGTLLATYSYWGEARPIPSVWQAAMICGIAATVCAVVESLPVRLNDNFCVGMTALLIGLALSPA